MFKTFCHFLNAISIAILKVRFSFKSIGVAKLELESGIHGPPEDRSEISIILLALARALQRFELETIKS